MVQLDYRDARPIYTQIYEKIREQILSDILCRGDKLPSVREMACELAINPNTIQRAYRQLEIDGWIASVPGKGNFVCGIPGDASKERRAALENFDKTVKELLLFGFSEEDLIARIGGNENA